MYGDIPFIVTEVVEAMQPRDLKVVSAAGLTHALKGSST
jgi:hypothetical protein